MEANVKAAGFDDLFLAPISVVDIEKKIIPVLKERKKVIDGMNSIAKLYKGESVSSINKWMQKAVKSKEK